MYAKCLCSSTFSYLANLPNIHACHRLPIQIPTDERMYSTREYHNARCKPSVICLAAKRGAGTVYNDQRVCDAFDLRLWLCMPEKFDAKGIMVSIIEHATQVQCDIRELKFLRASCSRWINLCWCWRIVTLRALFSGELYVKLWIVFC